MNKQLLVLLIFLSHISTSFAQNQIEGNQIRGIVKDSINKQPIDGAVIWVLKAIDNTPITQILTNEDGSFEINDPRIKIKLNVTCIGYNPYNSLVYDTNTKKNLPEILLNRQSKILDDIVIVGEISRPIIEQKAGKIIFNVENTISAQGSNALEILRQTPGVSVDENNSISINGQYGILIMLNGKQTYMQKSEIVDLLKSTASSNIKSIEVISNATAQYDAAGSGGILNIIMKKKEDSGFNMTLNNGVSYWWSLKQNTELSFNYRKKKFNLYGNYNHSLGHYGIRYGSDREQSGRQFDSRSHDTDKRNTIGTTLGADFEINKNHSIGIQTNGNFLFGPGLINTNIDVRDIASQELLYFIFTQSDYYHQTADRINTNFNYCFEDQNKQKLTVDFDYGIFSGDSKNRQPNTYYSVGGDLDSILNYRSEGNRDIDLYAFSINYQRPLWKGTLLAGTKYSNVSSNNKHQLFNVLSTQEFLDKESSNTFDFKESILSAYTQYDLSLNDNLTTNIGIRVENTYSKGYLKPISGSLQKESQVKRDYTDLFPSLGISYKLNKIHTFSVSYGKRIDRPVYSDLNPIEQPLDGFSSWKGNPFLLPQKTHRIGIQYHYNKTTVGVSYSITNDYRVQITDTLGTEKIIMIPKNLGKQTYYGLFLSQSVAILPGWSINLSGRVYHLTNKMAFDANRYFDRKRCAGALTMQTSFPLFWDVKVEFFGTFSSKRLGGSTEILGENSQVNLAFQKRFLNDKAIVKLTFTDIFWDSNWDNYNEFNGFKSKNYGYSESRQVKINFTYILGGKKTEKKQRNSNVESELNRF